MDKNKMEDLIIPLSNDKRVCNNTPVSSMNGNLNYGYDPNSPYPNLTNRNTTAIVYNTQVPHEYYPPTSMINQNSTNPYSYGAPQQNYYNPYNNQMNFDAYQNYLLQTRFFGPNDPRIVYYPDIQQFFITAYPENNYQSNIVGPTSSYFQYNCIDETSNEDVTDLYTDNPDYPVYSYSPNPWNWSFKNQYIKEIWIESRKSNMDYDKYFESKVNVTRIKLQMLSASGFHKRTNEEIENVLKITFNPVPIKYERGSTLKEKEELPRFKIAKVVNNTIYIEATTDQSEIRKLPRSRRMHTIMSPIDITNTQTRSALIMQKRLNRNKYLYETAIERKFDNVPLDEMIMNNYVGEIGAYYDDLKLRRQQSLMRFNYNKDNFYNNINKMKSVRTEYDLAAEKSSINQFGGYSIYGTINPDQVDIDDSVAVIDNNTNMITVSDIVNENELDDVIRVNNNGEYVNLYGQRLISGKRAIMPATNKPLITEDNVGAEKYSFIEPITKKLVIIPPTYTPKKYEEREYRNNFVNDSIYKNDNMKRMIDAAKDVFRTSWSKDSEYYSIY